MAKSFHINIADIVFLISLEGESSQALYSRLKKALVEFISENKNPYQRIKISGPLPGENFSLTQKGKTLEILAPKKVLKDKRLWHIFLDILTKYLRDFVLSYPDIILLHSAACAKDNKGYLFLGPSNSGKTTVARLSRPYSVLSDDQALVKRVGGGYRLFQMPLLSHEFRKLQKNITGPVFIDKIFLLRKKGGVQFKRVSKAQAMAAILEGAKELNRISKPDIKKAFNLSCGMARSIPAFRMHFKKDASFWRHIMRL